MTNKDMPAVQNKTPRPKGRGHSKGKAIGQRKRRNRSTASSFHQRSSENENATPKRGRKSGRGYSKGPLICQRRKKKDSSSQLQDYESCDKYRSPCMSPPVSQFSDKVSNNSCAAYEPIPFHLGHSSAIVNERQQEESETANELLTSHFTPVSAIIEENDQEDSWTLDEPIPSLSAPTSANIEDGKQEDTGSSGQLDLGSAPLECEFVPSKTETYEKLRKDLTLLAEDMYFKDFILLPYHKNIYLIQHYHSDNPAEKLSVLINCDFTACVRVHKIELDLNHEVWKEVPTVYKKIDDIKLLLQCLSNYHICVANPDDDFVKHFTQITSSGQNLTAYKEGNFGASNGEYEFTETIRTIKCSLLVKGIRCQTCQVYRGTLRKQKNRKKQTKAAIGLLSSKKPHAAQSKQELLEKLRAYKNYTLELEAKVKRMTNHINRAIKRKGMIYNRNDNEDVISMMEDLTPQVESTYQDPSSFQRLFWDQQKRFNENCKTSMRWHPMIIKWCLYLQSKSAKGYQAMRESGFISLPSERTLYDYSHCLPAENGYQKEYVEHIVNEARVKGLYEEDWKNYVGILQDEMKVKEGLVYDRTSGELVGYVNLDEFGNQMLKLEDLGGKNEQKLAKYFLVLMVRGITTNLCYPLAGFATSGVTADLLYNILWQGVRILELDCALKVLFITCDGASANRRFFSLHQLQGDENINWTYNRYSVERRKLFFISDIPHLLKTTRNCFSNSWAHKQSRFMWKNKEVSWLHIVRLYEEHIEEKIYSPCPKITRSHIHLTPFSQMKVNLAAQIFSSTVANALEELYGDEVSETVNLIRHLNKFFDCLNTRHLSEGVKKRNPVLAPYRHPDDPRIHYLLTDFLGYFSEWKTMVERRDNFSKSQQAKMMLSHQTLKGLDISVRSITECVQFLLRQGAPFILTNKFNQDPLEAHFSHYRHKGGANDNPMMYDVNNTMCKLRVIGSSALAPIRGNVKRSPSDRKYIIDQSPMAKRPRSKE